MQGVMFLLSQALPFEDHKLWAKALLDLSFFIFKVGLIVPTLLI